MSKAGLAITAICWLPPQTAVLAQLEPKVFEHELLRDYPAALRRLEDYYTHLRGHAVEEEKRAYVDRPIPKDFPKNRIGIGGNPFPMDTYRRTELDFALNGDLRLVETRSLLTKITERKPDKTVVFTETNDPKKVPPHRVLCISPSSGFHLYTHPETHALTVAAVGERATITHVMNQTINATITAPYSLMNSRIIDLMSDPTFAPTSIKEVKVDGVNRVRVDFLVKFKNKELFPYSKGWFEVAPAESWVLKRYETTTAQYEHAADAEVKYEQSAHAEGIPHLISVRRRLVGYDTTTTFDKLVHEDVPKTAFTMTAFGLPDITKPIAEHVPGRSAAWYFWAAGGAILVALGLRFAASRGGSGRRLERERNKFRVSKNWR